MVETASTPQTTVHWLPPSQTELWRGNATNDGSGSIDTFIAIENLTGGSANDILTGNALTNIINGGAGNDNVNGGAGNDTVNGGLGNDTMIGGTGVDTLNGGDGIDTADYSALAYRRHSRTLAW